jgi:tetratricopeptide (TPR) repeat protein
MKDEQEQITIFISYSHKNFEVADEIESAFKGMPILIRRDIRDVAIGKSFKDFMQGISKSNFVLLILSDEFLKSSSCLFEVLELLNTHSFNEKILPVITDNSNPIYSLEGRLNYYLYWKKELAYMEELITTNINSDFLNKLKHLREINNKIDLFFEKIIDVASISFTKLKKMSYKPLFERIGITEHSLLGEAVEVWLMTDKEEREIAIHKLLEKSPGNKYVLLANAFAVSVRGEELKRGNFLYEDLISKFPDFESGIQSYAIYAHDYLKDYSLARNLYKKCLAVSNQNNFTHSNLARLLYEEFDEVDQAKFHFEEAIKLGAEDFQCFLTFGKLLDDGQNDYKAAIAQYEKVLAKIPDYYLAHYYLAKIYYEKISDFFKAAIHYKKALSANPNFFEGNNDYGHLLAFGKNDVNRGLNYFLKALKIKPDSALIHQNLGSVYMIKENYTEAIVHFEKVLEIIEDEKVCFNLGIIYQHFLIDIDKAAKYFEKAIAIKPDYAKAYLSYFNLLAKNNSFTAKAIELYKMATKLNSDLINPEIDLKFNVIR